MRVKCVLCDHIESIDSNSHLAKKLRNRPIHTYMCKSCEERITDKTNKRLQTGNFRFFKAQLQEDEW